MSKGAVKEIATSDKGALKRFVAFERQLAGSNPLFRSCNGKLGPLLYHCYEMRLDG